MAFTPAQVKYLEGQAQIVKQQKAAAAQQQANNLQQDSGNPFLQAGSNQAGMMQTTAAGMVDPVISGINRGGAAMAGVDNYIRQLGHKLGLNKGGAYNQNYSRIPVVAANPNHKIAYYGGSILPFAVGAGEVARGIGLAGDAMGAGEALATGVGRAGTNIAASAVTGGVEAPAEQGEQGAMGGAIGGAAGSAIGAAAGRILPKIAAPILKSTQYENLKSNFLKGLPTSTEAKAQRGLFNDILNHYQQSRNMIRPQYDQVFDVLKANNDVMTPEDFPFLQEEISKDLSAKERPLIPLRDLPLKPNTDQVIAQNRQIKPFSNKKLLFNAKHNAWMMKGPNKKMVFVDQDGNPVLSQGIDPEQVHYLQSRYGQLAQKNLDNPQGNNFAVGSRQKAYQNALQNDLQNYLSNKGLDQKYQMANDNWRKALAPYKNSKIFQKVIRPNMDYEKIGEIEGTPISNSDIHLLKTSSPVSQMAKKVLPGGNEADDSAYRNLATLLGGDTNLARLHARNLMVAKHINDDTIDFEGLSKSLNKLKDENKNFLLTPEEQGKLKTMATLKKQQLSPAMKRFLLGATAGAAGLTHGPVTGVLAGALGFAGKPYLDAVADKFLGAAPVRGAVNAMKDTKVKIPNWLQKGRRFALGAAGQNMNVTSQNTSGVPNIYRPGWGPDHFPNARRN